jgi:hypothetical protein
MDLLVQIRKGSSQFLVQIGYLVIQVGFKNAEEAEESVLPAAFLEAKGLDLPSRVFSGFVAMSCVHFSKYIILANLKK